MKTIIPLLKLFYVYPRVKWNHNRKLWVAIGTRHAVCTDKDFNQMIQTSGMSLVHLICCNNLDSLYVNITQCGMEILSKEPDFTELTARRVASIL